MKKIYFGGGHDNGYTTNLTMIQNEAYLDKVVLLKSYTQLAAEIKALGLPCLENNGVFFSERLSLNSVDSTNGGANWRVSGMNWGESGGRALPDTAVPQLASMPISAPKPASRSIEVVSRKSTEENINKIKVCFCSNFYVYVLMYGILGS